MKKNLYAVTFNHMPEIEYHVAGFDTTEAISRAWDMYLEDKGKINSCLEIEVRKIGDGLIQPAPYKRGDYMINIRTLKKIHDNGGLTLKNGKPIIYKSGWQVATEGVETTDIQEAIKMVRTYGGNCGIWFSGGVWYIDKSHRVNTKHEALEIGIACNQISVLRWRDMGLVYCQSHIF